MLDDHIFQQLKSIELEREHLTQQLQILTQEESEENDRITKLIAQEDVGASLFSPRGSVHTDQKELEILKKHVEELQFQEMTIRQKIEENNQKTDRYHQLLSEAENNSIKDKKGNEIDRSQYKEDLENILRRVEKCISLIQRDRLQCKTELTQLQYYLKALLSKKEK